MATTLNSTGILFPDSSSQTTAYLGGAGKATNLQTFNTSGTWTKPSGYGANSRVYIQVWGGGGAGGTGPSALGGGGGGGAYNERWVTLSTLGSTETVTVGAGGTITSVGSAGGSGGNSSFGSIVTAYGGGGGFGKDSGAPDSANGGGGGGQFSAGEAGAVGNAAIQGGRPYLVVWPRDSAGTKDAVNVASSSALGHASIQGGAGGSVSSLAIVFDSYKHGGGGGSYKYFACPGDFISTGADSVYGGGGGGANGGGNARAGGTSLFGGNGGAAGNTTGTAGTAPGGGGGSGGTTGASGAAGRVVVVIFDGS